MMELKTCILYERAKLVTCKHHNVNMKYKDRLLMKHRPYLLLYFQLFFRIYFQLLVEHCLLGAILM
jgi:hypothetical protein